MNRITVDNSLKSRLDGLAEPVEICDETGNTLGHFVPSAVSDDCPYSAEELIGMRREAGGRSLGEIWKSLGAQ